MFAFIGVCRFLVEAIVQPVPLLLLWIGCSGDDLKKHRIRILAWIGCVLFALLEILLPLLLLDFEEILGKVVAAAGIGNFLLSYVTFFNGTLTFVVALQSILLPSGARSRAPSGCRSHLRMRGDQGDPLSVLCRGLHPG
jgi:hypothetical protein